MCYPIQNDLRINRGWKMKTLLLQVMPLLFIVFAACGGGDSNEEPPKPNGAPLTQEGFKTQEDMLAQLRQLKTGACEQQGTQVIAILVASRQANPPLPGYPPPAPVRLPDPNPQCVNLLNNIIWNFTHIVKQNGEPWANDIAAKLWLARQIAGFLNHLRDKAAPVLVASGIDPNQTLQVFASDLKPYFQNMMGQVGSGTAFMMNAQPYLNAF